GVQRAPLPLRLRHHPLPPRPASRYRRLLRPGGGGRLARALHPPGPCGGGRRLGYRLAGAGRHPARPPRAGRRPARDRQPGAVHHPAGGGRLLAARGAEGRPPGGAAGVGGGPGGARPPGLRAGRTFRAGHGRQLRRPAAHAGRLRGRLLPGPPLTGIAGNQWGASRWRPCCSICFLTDPASMASIQGRATITWTAWSSTDAWPETVWPAPVTLKPRVSPSQRCSIGPTMLPYCCWNWARPSWMRRLASARVSWCGTDRVRFGMRVQAPREDRGLRIGAGGHSRGYAGGRPFMIDRPAVMRSQGAPPWVGRWLGGWGASWLAYPPSTQAPPMPPSSAPQ